MIRVEGLTKAYGTRRAVDDLTFDVQPGTVTGFLGPNGAGKSTTMRLVMGLDSPTSGTATIAGRPYRELAHPAREVGALLDAQAIHPGRTGRAHLRIAALAMGLPAAAVDQAIDRVGLGPAADRRVRGYSLGMRQRLGIAAALLGDPGVLLFDEPVNGLDLEGVRWIRDLVRGAAAEGRTVLVSSHLMSEVQTVADRVVVIGRGRLVAEASVAELRAGRGPRARVRTPDADTLVARIPAPQTRRLGAEELEVEGLTAAELGEVAHRAGVRVHHLSDVEHSLEQAYLELTDSSVEFSGSATGGAA